MEKINEFSRNNSYDIHDMGSETNRTQYTANETNRILTAEETTVICILFVFSVLGTLGNGLVLYVFTRMAEKFTSTIFILALAGTDIVACLVVMPVTVSAIHVAFQFRFDFICKLYTFLTTSFIPLSAFIMLAIGVDRYICICHPYIRIMTVKRAKFIVSILAAFAIVLGIITSLGFSVNNTGRCFLSSAILTSNFLYIYQKVYSSIFFIPLLIVLILYGMIYRSVLKHRAKHRRLRLKRPQSQTQQSIISLNSSIAKTQSPNNLCVEMNKERESIKMTSKHTGPSDGQTVSSSRLGASTTSSTKAEKESNRLANIKTAMMLFVVTVVFLIAFLPAWLMGNGWVKRNIVVYHMYFVCNVANPFIYALMNRRFRDRLVAMIIGCQRYFNR